MPALAMLHQIAGRELSADPSDFCRVPRHRLRAVSQRRSRRIVESRTIAPVVPQRQERAGWGTPCFSRSINVCIIYARYGKRLN